jgi:hypothetical protein
MEAAFSDEISRYQASGLGLRHFAEQNRIAVNSLRYWIHAKGHPNASELARAVTPRFQEIRLSRGLLWVAEMWSRIEMIDWRGFASKLRRYV